MRVYKNIQDDILTNVDFHLINSCNLNCVSCGHFCPLVKNEQPQTFDNIKQQLERLAVLTKNGDKLQTLTLTGGEITLREDLYDIVDVAAHLFHNNIRIWSNGIKFHELIKLKPILQDNHNIDLFITNYEQDFTWKTNEELSKNIPGLFLIDKAEYNNKVYFNWQFLDAEEVSDDEEILNCTPRNWCNQLVNFRLYVCQYLAYFKYFDKYFKDQHSVPWSENLGSIDIREVDSIEEIKQFMSKFNCDFCKHCLDCKEYREQVEWRTSSRKIEEWYNA